MVCVLADDFTGAAEIAGIIWRSGLESEITYDTDNRPHTDFVIIDADTRSKEEYEIEQILADLVRGILALKPLWIYKKTDSILRGHVLKELRFLQKAFAKKRIVLVPANPSLRRIIKQGIYYINGIPLDQTDFARDPEYPRFSSRVSELLGISGEDHPVMAGINESLPDAGLIIGEASQNTDMEYFSELIDNHTLAAGASDFFHALLRKKNMILKNRSTDMYRPGKKRMIIVGSSTEQSRINLHVLKKKGVEICHFPYKIDQSQDIPSICVQDWSEKIIKTFKNSRQVAAAINQPVKFVHTVARNLAEYTAQMVEQVLGYVQLDEMIIEGGGTASKIIRRLGWKHLRPTAELAPGIVALQIYEKPELNLTVKPGSYAWPEILSG